MPVGVQCPISSSLGEFPSYWDWLWCPSPFPSLSILGVFHLLLSTIGFQSCFFFTADVSPPIRSHLTNIRISVYINVYRVRERHTDRQSETVSLFDALYTRVWPRGINYLSLC